MVNYIAIEDEPEGLPEHNNGDIEGINKFLTTLYDNRHNNSPFKMYLDRAIYLRSTYSKLQELAETANKKKDICIIEEIVPNYILKHFAKVFSQEASQ